VEVGTVLLTAALAVAAKLTATATELAGCKAARASCTHLVQVLTEA
jgi:hypothetical protein